MLVFWAFRADPFPPLRNASVNYSTTIYGSVFAFKQVCRAFGKRIENLVVCPVGAQLKGSQWLFDMK